MFAPYVSAALVPLKNELPDMFKNSWIFYNLLRCDRYPYDEIYLGLHRCFIN